MHQNSTFATSQNAAPATKLKKRNKVLRLPRKNYTFSLTRFLSIMRLPRKMQTQSRRMSQNATKHAICEKIDLQHSIRITFCERRPTVRLSTVAVVETKLGKHASNLTVKREPFATHSFGKNVKGCLPIISRKIYFKQHSECFGYRNSSSLSSWWMHKLHLAIIAQEGGEALTEWCLESASRRWLICLMLTWKTACPREPPNTAVWAEQCHGLH